MKSVKTLIFYERMGAKSVLLLENSLQVIMNGTRNISRFIDAACDKVCEIGYKLDDKLFNLRWHLRCKRYNIRPKYYKLMSNLADKQAKLRHERLALVALEKVRLETEAETLAAAAKGYAEKL